MLRRSRGTKSNSGTRFGFSEWAQAKQQCRQGGRDHQWPFSPAALLWVCTRASAPMRLRERIDSKAKRVSGPFPPAVVSETGCNSAVIAWRHFIYGVLKECALQRAGRGFLAGCAGPAARWRASTQAAAPPQLALALAPVPAGTLWICAYACGRGRRPPAQASVRRHSSVQQLA